MRCTASMFALLTGPPGPEVGAFLPSSLRVLRVDGSVDEVAVDVDRHAAPCLVVVALVLVDATAPRPDRRRQHVRVVGEQVGPYGPARDPDRVDGRENRIRPCAHLCCEPAL